MMSDSQNKEGNYVLLIVLAIGLMTVTGTADDEKSESKDHHLNSSIEIADAFNDVGYSTLKDYVSEFNQIPLYYHVYNGKELISQMKMTKKSDNFQNFQTKGYEPEKGRHNINIYGGRAAWVFERFFDVTLPKITSKSGEDEFSTCREKATEYLNAYQEGLIAVSSRQHKSGISIKNLVNKYKDRTGRKSKFVKVYRSAIRRFKNSYQFGVSTKDLIKKYKDIITHGLTDFKTANTSHQNFKKLLAEWMPIGKRLSDLTDIVGEDPEELTRPFQTGDYHYYFDNGRGGWGYKFNVKSGTIRSVSPGSIN